MLVILEILIILTLSLGALIFGILFVNFFKKRTELNQLLIIAYFGVGFGILFENIFLQYFLLLHVNVFFYNALVFALELFFLGIGISATLRISILLSESTGHKVRLGKFLRIFYICVPIFFSILNYMSFYETPINEFGYFYYQTNPYLMMALIFTYIPLLIYLLVRESIFLKSVSKELRRKGLILGVIFATIPIMRITHLASYPILGNSFFVILGYHVILIILLLIFASLLLYDMKFIEKLFFYFAVNALFIIKDNGQSIFGYNFKSLEDKEYFSQQQLLLGGFIHAISKGLENTLYFHGKLKTIEIGTTSLIIRNGEHVFVVLFTSEVTKTIKENLELFLQEFETAYKKELQNWTGSMSDFDSKKFEELVLKYFR